MPAIYFPEQKMPPTAPIEEVAATAALKNTRRRSVSVALVGLGLVLAGGALWAILADARAGYASLSADFTAVPVEVSFKAPVLTLRDLSGYRRSLGDYAGQVVLVNLWATWCPPCAAEMPEFQRYYENHRDSQFTVIAINDGELAAAVGQFVADYGLTFPIWLDPTYDATERAFQAGNLPTSYVIDRHGIVRLMWIGAIQESNLEKFVTPIIEE
jgi:thiol-disulfide isomerase/thioredoxin